MQLNAHKVPGSRFSPAAGLKTGQFDQERNFAFG
jgi:hypothetical protein